MGQIFKTSDEQQAFYKTDLYANVKKRKEKLQKKLLKIDRDSWNKVIPISKVSKEYDVEELVDFLQQYQQVDGFEIDEDSSRVLLPGKKGNTICDFICVEYFRLYAVSEDKTEIQRFSYFELYYDQYVFSCIADANMLKRPMLFPALNFESSDWALAQQQMRLWNHYLLPKIEELPIPRSIFPVGIKERIHCGVYDVEIYFIAHCTCPDIGNPLWKVITYIHLLQLLPILPKVTVPWYYLNLVCKNKNDIKVFAEKLRVFLEEYSAEDPVIKGEVRLSQRLFLEKKSDKESYRAVPYVLVLEKAKDINQLLDAFSETDGIKKRRNHPFKDTIPICISDRQIQDSTVLNIDVQDIEKMSWDSTKYTMVLGSFASILNRYRMYKDKKSTRSWMETARKDIQKVIAEYCDFAGLSPETLSNLMKFEPKTLELLSWFLLLRQNFESELSLSEDERLFALNLFKALTQAQNNLNIIVDGLMIHFRKEFDERADKRPTVDNDNIPEEKLFKTNVSGEWLLCFYPAYFPEWLKTHNQNVLANDVLNCLKARGLLAITNGKRNLKTIKLNRETPKKKSKDVAVDCYAIIMK